MPYGYGETEIMPARLPVIGNNRLLLIGIGTVALLFCCCVTSTTKHPYTLSERYVTADLSKRKTVVVFPSDNFIIIHNKKDVTEDYGGLNSPPESRIGKFYFPEMLSTIKSFVSGDSITSLEDCRPGLDWDTLATATVSMKTGNDSIPMKYAVPEKTRMQVVGMDSMVVIIIESIEFKRNNFRCEYYWDDKTRVPANLEVTATVMIWDYADDMPVFYGPISSKIEFTFGLQRKHWDESARTLAKKLVVAAKCL